MKKAFNSMIMFLLGKLKKIVDKFYYKKYHLYKQETLVRDMFPGLHNLDNYGRLNSYLQQTSPSELDQLVKAILSYYWAEVATLHARYDYTSVASLKGLYDFAITLQAYKRELESINSN